MNVNEIYLHKDEEIKKCSVISKASIVVLWLSIPCALALSGTAFFRILRLVSFFDKEIANLIFWIVATPLIIAWFGFSCVSTYLNTQDAVVYTNQRIICSTRTKTLESPLGEIKNIFVERSLFGRLFKYGTITVQTEKGSLTVKNLSDPETIRREVISLSEENDDNAL